MTSLTGRWRCDGKGHSLPYRVFSKDQRVSHTAIVENKRLGHALAIVKAQQDLKHATEGDDQQREDSVTKETRDRVYGPDLQSENPSAQKRWKCRSDGKRGKR